MKHLEDRIAVLEEELDIARETIRQLRESGGFLMVAPLCLRLAPSEAAIFGALMKKEGVTKTGLMTALYADPGSDETPDEKIIDVFVCKLRKKVAPFGIAINTYWGNGYGMPPESKAVVRQLLAGEGIDAPELGIPQTTANKGTNL